MGLFRPERRDYHSHSFLDPSAIPSNGDSDRKSVV
mgnify:CR=1 FL=1